MPKLLVALLAGLIAFALFAPAVLAEDYKGIVRTVPVKAVADQKIAPGLATAMAAAGPQDELNIIVFLDNPSASIDGEVSYRYHRIPAVAVTVPKVAIYKMVARPDVKRIFYDDVRHITVTDTGNVGIQLETSTSAIGAPAVWAAGYNGSGIKVAVIDTGVWKDHPDLAGRVVAEKDFVNDDDDAADDNGHGTHVAGIIAATNASGNGIRGVAPGAELLAAKVCNEWGSCWDKDIIAGVEWALDNGADVVSISIGGLGTFSDGMSGLSQAINQMADSAVFAIAAGNDGPVGSSINFPGDAFDVITVAAVNDTGTADVGDDSIAYFSSRGSAAFGRFDPDLAAPGVGINSTVPTSGDLSDPSGYRRLSGTSMATPHVSGAAALLLQARPDLTPADVRSVLMQTAMDIGQHPFKQGTGEINVSAAVFGSLLAGPDRWETLLEPGQTSTFTTTIENSGAADVTITWGTSDLTDLKLMYTMDDSAIGLPAQATISAGGSATVTFSLTVPEDATPGVYATALVGSADNGQAIRIPVALAVAGRQFALTGTAGSDDYLLVEYPVVLAPNTTALNFTLNWTDASTDMDLYVGRQEGDYGRLVGSSWNWGNTPENIYLTNPMPATYWAYVTFYSGAATEYNLYVETLSNVSVSPESLSATLAPGTSSNVTITVTNDGQPKAGLNVSVTSLAEQTAYAGTRTVPNSYSGPWCELDTNGYALYRIGDFTGERIAADMTSVAMDVNISWSDPANRLSMKIYTWADNGDGILDPTITNDPWALEQFAMFGSQQSIRLTDYSVWALMRDVATAGVGTGTQVDGLALIVCGESVTNTSDTLEVNITLYNMSAASWATADTAGLDMAADETSDVNITVDTTGLTAGTYGGMFTVMSGETWLAHVPLELTVDDTPPTGTVTLGTSTIWTGDLVQEVTITYDEAMDGMTVPAISFTGASGDLEPNGDGAWDSTNTTWTETFTHNGTAEETSGVIVDSSGAFDAAGNMEGPSVPDTFDIDTAAPTVTNFNADTNITSQNLPVLLSVDAADANLASVGFILLDQANLTAPDMPVIWVVSNESGLNGPYSTDPPGAWPTLLFNLTNGSSAESATAIVNQAETGVAMVFGMFKANATATDQFALAFFNISDSSLVAMNDEIGNTLTIQTGASTFTAMTLKFADGLFGQPSWANGTVAFTLYDIGNPDNPAITYGLVPDGNYSAMIRATDAAGNIAGGALTLTVDNTPPAITIASPAAMTYTSTSIDFNWAAVDALDVACSWSLNSGANTSISGNTTITATAGGNSLVLFCTDTAGNEGSETVAFTVSQQNQNNGGSGGWMSYNPVLMQKKEPAPESGQLTEVPTASQVNPTGTATGSQTDNCDNCTEPTAWSECNNGIQSRTVWSCGPATGGACIESTETRACSEATGPSGAFAVGGIGALTQMIVDFIAGIWQLLAGLF